MAFRELWFSTVLVNLCIDFVSHQHNILRRLTSARQIDELMNPPQYKLILTRSSHAISAAAAEEIHHALTKAAPAIEVDIALYGDQVRRTLINTAHVIALVEEPSTEIVAPATRELRVVARD